MYLINTKESLLETEISTLPLLTNFRSLKIYAFKGNEAPALINEIGRLREHIFSKAGAGRGGELDLDELDFGDYSYTQMIAWDPEYSEIVAMYRYQYGEMADDHGLKCLRTSRLFQYSDLFTKHYLPHAIELGRSAVYFNARKHRFGLFAIWKGLHHLIKSNPKLQYFFGNVSIYQTMNPDARDILIHFLEEHYRPPQPLLIAHKDCAWQAPSTGKKISVTENTNTDTPKTRIKELSDLLSPFNERIPPIIQSYMSISNSIWFGETTIDQDFGNAFETGLVVPVTTELSFMKKLNI